MSLEIPAFDDVEELKKFRWEDFDAGLGTASSLIMMCRITRPDMVKYRPYVERALRSSIRLYQSFRHFLEETRPDLVYVTNGRWAHSRALFRACSKAGVTCLVHESASSKEKFEVYENALPHDRAYTEREIRETWRRAGGAQFAVAIAGDWYEKRSAGIDLEYFSFVRNQDPGRLPDEWIPGAEQIVVFTSSEDEFASIGPEWENPLFSRQSEGLEALCGLAAAVRPNAHLVVRIHPNLTGSRDPELESYYALRERGVTVVPPESTVSSYALLKKADVVVTFGSTMGIEANYWGRPSILLGMSFYRGLGGTYNCSSVEELRRLLGGEIPALGREAALMYGYYMATFGIPYKYYQAEGVVEGRFRGIELNDNNSLVERTEVALRRWDRIRWHAGRFFSRQ